MTEQQPPQEGHPDISFVPPPSGGSALPGQGTQGASPPPQIPLYQPPPHQLVPPGPGKRNVGKIAVMITLATLLVAGAGAGIWWFLLRGNGGFSGQEPLEGLAQEPAIAWERSTSQATSVLGAPEGMVVAPDQSRGETEMVMLDWNNGETKWAVDIGSDIGAANFIYFEKTLPGGLVGLVVVTSQEERTLLLHRLVDGERVGTLNLGKRMLLPSNSDALYLFEPIDPSEGTGTISRVKSLDDFETREWVAQAAIGGGDVTATVVEKNGYAHVCWMDQYGEPERCSSALSLQDGSRPPWHDGKSVFREIDDVIVTTDLEGNIAAYDQQGQALWQRTGKGQALRFVGDMILLNEEQDATVERLDPKTGQALWTRQWQAGGPSGFVHNGRTVVVYSYGTFRAGVVNPATGETDLLGYPVETPGSTFRTADGGLIIQGGTAGEDRIELTSITPGEPDPRWARSFTGYTGVEQHDRKLVLRGAGSLAVLK